MTDYIFRVFAILGVAAPSFWVATLLLLYTVRYHLFTIDLLGQPLLWQHPAASFNCISDPGLAGGIASGAGVMRLLRSQMLEVLRQITSAQRGRGVAAARDHRPPRAEERHDPSAHHHRPHRCQPH